MPTHVPCGFVTGFATSAFIQSGILKVSRKFHKPRLNGYLLEIATHFVTACGCDYYQEGIPQLTPVPLPSQTDGQRIPRAPRRYIQRTRKMPKRPKENRTPRLSDSDYEYVGFIYRSNICKPTYGDVLEMSYAGIAGILGLTP